MPTQPKWFPRLTEILAELRALTASHLDRHAVEKLFQVRQRRARQLMAGLPCLQVGNAVAVERSALLQRLETIAAAESFHWEISRRARVAESIESLRMLATARRIRIPVLAGMPGHSLTTLPPGIQLQPGELRIEFQTAEDLAAKLFALSQAMANDWDTFNRTIKAK